MLRSSVVACAIALLVGFSGVQAQDEDGDLLRYKFAKGEKFTLDMSNNMSVKITEMPEEFEGLLGEEAIDIKFEMVVELTVAKVGDDGKATLKGKIKKLKVTGNMVVQELDFEYDADKDDGDEGDEGDEGGGFGGFDIEGALRTFARQPVEMSVDQLGNVKLESAAEGMGGSMAGQFLTLNGFMGALPKERVEEGGTWNRCGE